MNYVYKLLFIYCLFVGQNTLSSAVSAEQKAKEEAPKEIEENGRFEGDADFFWVRDTEASLRLSFDEGRYQLSTAFGKYFFDKKEFEEVQFYNGKEWKTYKTSKKEKATAGVAFFRHTK